ncbi:hypothetical protein DH2020_020553 [Rehmannia glutinosa]|uniref:Uncharacterized protein n=1 Tax=Rehmannia glutinosa TaxID=99300 RepID=A0ABR0WJZ2_REHGL
MGKREGVLRRLRGEFATANAIIEALCCHLKAVGEPGEYDSVLGSIEQIRSSWDPILRRQRFSVAEVGYLTRRQQQNAVRMRGGGNNFMRGDFNGKSEADNFEIGQGSTQGAAAHADDKAEAAGSCRVDGSELARDEKQNLQVSPKTYDATEICGGESINIAEGLKQYENLFDDSEISKLITLVNGLRHSGWRGQLQGQTFVTSKRPMNGHGREMIQFGVPIADERLEDAAARGTSKGMVMTNSADVEPIPDLLQNVIERLLTEKVVSIKPDSTIIDFFDEGEHSQPHIWPQCVGRPVCVLFLTECEMSFGWDIAVDYPGGCHQGALKLSLLPGIGMFLFHNNLPLTTKVHGINDNCPEKCLSMLVLQGRSADFSRHAIPSVRKKRILVTFVKSQPKKINTTNIYPFPSRPASSSNWARPPSRPPSHVRTLAPYHFRPIPPTGILPGIVFPAPVALQTASAGWPLGAPPPSRPPSHVRTLAPYHFRPIPPTGVLPGIAFPAPVSLQTASAGWSSSGSSSNLPVSTLSTENIIIEPPALLSEENSIWKPNDRRTLLEAGSSSRARVQWGTVITNGEEHENHDSDK